MVIDISEKRKVGAGAKDNSRLPRLGQGRDAGHSRPQRAGANPSYSVRPEGASPVEVGSTQRVVDWSGS
jgi:hypothetical protein